MMSCRSSKQTLQQRQTERVADTVRETVFVCDTVAETVAVYDTIREITTIQLNADGDTMSRTTEREHVSDRTRGRASASHQTATSQRSHEEESTSDEKQTVVEQPKAKPIKPFLWGTLTGIVLTIAAIIFVKLRKR